MSNVAICATHAAEGELYAVEEVYGSRSYGLLLISMFMLCQHGTFSRGNSSMKIFRQAMKKIFRQKRKFFGNFAFLKLISHTYSHVMHSLDEFWLRYASDVFVA